MKNSPPKASHYIVIRWARRLIALDQLVLEIHRAGIGCECDDEILRATKLGHPSFLADTRNRLVQQKYLEHQENGTFRVTPDGEKAMQCGHAEKIESTRPNAVSKIPFRFERPSDGILKLSPKQVKDILAANKIPSPGVIIDGELRCEQPSP